MADIVRITVASDSTQRSVELDPRAWRDALRVLKDSHASTVRAIGRALTTTEGQKTMPLPNQHTPYTPGPVTTPTPIQQPFIPVRTPNTGPAPVRHLPNHKPGDNGPR